MIKRLIAVAITAATAVPAVADNSNVTIYGVIDYGLAARSGSDTNVVTDGTKNEFASGLGTGGSRIGLRGNENLGDGMTAIWELEFGLNVDSATDGSSAAFTNRHSWVGVTGNYGTFIGGRLDGGRASVIKQYDVFQGTGVGNLGSLAEPLTTRADNAIAYVSPKWNGFGVTAAFTKNLIGQELPGNSGDSPVYALIFSYTNGPLSLTYDHEEEWFQKTALPRIHANMFGASYDFGVVKLSAYGEHISMETTSGIPLLDVLKDLNTGAIGITVPVMSSKGLVKASWARRDRRLTDDTCDKWAVGFKYNLSKRTFLYTDYARINNKDNGTCSIALYNESRSSDYQTNTDGGGSFAGGTPGGYGTRGFDLGIAHSF